MKHRHSFVCRRRTVWPSVDFLETRHKSLRSKDICGIDSIEMAIPRLSCSHVWFQKRKPKKERKNFPQLPPPQKKKRKGKTETQTSIPIRVSVYQRYGGGEGRQWLIFTDPDNQEMSSVLLDLSAMVGLHKATSRLLGGSACNIVAGVRIVLISWSLIPSSMTRFAWILGFLFWKMVDLIHAFTYFHQLQLHKIYKIHNRGATCFFEISLNSNVSIWLSYVVIIVKALQSICIRCVVTGCRWDDGHWNHGLPQYQ